MILKLKEVEPLYNALKALDGDPPFKFSRQVTWNKGRNLEKLAKVREKISKERDELIRSLANGDQTVPKERVPEFIEQFNELLAVEEDIHLLQLDPEGLDIFDKVDNPTGNVIPSSLLEGVMKLIPET